MTAPAEDFTELVDADIPRVDLVGKAANGTRFLMRKAADDGLLQPLVAPEQVRELLAKADAQEGTVTDPAPDDVTKDAPPVDTGDLIEDAPGGSTAESLPGSPDWEQLDGDTAMNAVATLGRVKACLQWLSDREAQEAVTGGDGDDADNSFDLDDMACQLDWMIGRLAGFAVGEHMEADMADELEQVGKAAAELVAPVAVVEKLAPIAKAGRVLSSANEQLLRTAGESIEKVLASLPQAPTAEDGDTVTKTEETTVPEPTAPEAPAAEPVDVLAKALAALPKLDAAAVAGALLAGGRAQDVAKAKGDPQMAVFNADGKLVGVIDPADLNPIADTAPPADSPKAEEPAAEAPAEAATPAADAAAPAAEPAERTVPGTNTVQAPPQAPDDQTPAVAKTAATAQLEEPRDLATSEVIKGLEAKVVALEEQVRKFGMQPDDRRSPVLNGATGIPGAVARDSSEESPLADLKKAIDEEPDPVKRDEMRKAAFFAGVKARFEQA